jgi:hypothetical protein
MAGRIFIPEHLTWLGYAPYRTEADQLAHVPQPLSKVGHLAYDRGALTHDYYRAMEQQVQALRGHRFSRLQLMGYSRIDTMEKIQIQSFIHAAYEMRVLPEDKSDHEQWRPDANPVGWHLNPHRGVNFLYVGADFYTCDELRAFAEKLYKL